MGWGVLVSVMKCYMGVGCPGKCCGALHGVGCLGKRCGALHGVRCPGKRCGALHEGGVSW